ncbi:MAG: HAMP domain-containing sensor histidine kinase [Candidatus Roizmanbacteria bacterium]|nr:HAMP domain-containing sensor histidine kinase [Candidatus Roizmanbacteria bacterium]
MSVSISFSIVIYRGMTAEIDRFTQLQRLRIERRFDDAGLPPPPILIDRDMVDEAKQHIILNFLGVNGIIFIVMGGLSYFLAGKTLEPIQEMMEEQHRFVSDASHELKTPLTAMKSSLEVYVRDPKLTLGEAKQVLLDNIQEVNRLQSLSESLLTLSENQSSNSQHSFTQISPKAIITKAYSQVKYSSDAKKIKVHIISLPDKKINGNEEKLIELFTILLDNAIKYSPEGKSISIMGRLVKYGIEFRIMDKGIGIGEVDIPHVFDRFFRSDSARSRTGVGGYGLGLPIAKKIVEFHKGNIYIESKVDNGTTVIVRLPLA